MLKLVSRKMCAVTNGSEDWMTDYVLSKFEELVLFQYLTVLVFKLFLLITCFISELFVINTFLDANIAPAFISWCDSPCDRSGLNHRF